MGAAAIAAPAAYAVTATTTVEITFPQVLILYSYDTIQLDVTEATLATELGVTGASCTSGSYCVQFTNAGPLDWDMNSAVNADIATAASALPDLSAVAVNIENAWGVRSVAAAGGLTAGVTGPTSLTGPGASLAVSGATTDNFAPTRGMGALDSTRTGSIDFTLNLSTLNTAGTYTGDFVISVTSP